MIYYVAELVSQGWPEISVKIIDAKVPTLDGLTNPCFFNEQDAIAFKEQKEKEYGPYAPDEKPVQFVIVSY